jgi:hypothetical protein
MTIIGRAGIMATRGVAAGVAIAAVTLVTVLVVSPAVAQRVGSPGDNRIENQVAVFAALDKVTARISKLEIPLGESVNFGALTVTPRTCYSRSPLEAPKTSTFVEVSEKQLDGQSKKIFGGWMFAESPGLNAVEHPVYDVWLTDCAKPKNVATAGPARGSAKGTAQPPPRPQQPSTGSQPGAPPRPAQAGPGPGQAGPAQVGPAQVGQPAPGAQPPPAPQPAPGAWGATTTDQTVDDFKRRRPPR